MKILVLIHSLAAGGAERVTANLANYWVKGGHTVNVVTLAGREIDHYALDSQVGRIALQADSESYGTLQAIANNLQRVRAIRAVLNVCRPDVAVGMMAQTSCLLALAAIGTRVPVVGSERIHPPRWPLPVGWEYMRRAVYPRLASIVAQTQESAIWLENHVRARRVVVIPNAVEFPLQALEPHVPTRLALRMDGSKRRLLLSVGRLTPQKGFDRLIAAFAAVARDFREWDLAILGEGAGRHELENQVRATGMTDRILLPGRVGNVGDWYAAADLFALTSRFEGFPNVLLEALAYGLPAVSVDCETGPRDIIRHEVDGLLVPRNDQRALVQALTRLMTNERLRSECAARAREARQRFAIDRIAGKWIALFEGLLTCNRND